MLVQHKQIMSNDGISKSRRCRGRPRKNIHYSNMTRLISSSPSQDTSLKHKHAIISTSDGISVLDEHGELDISKKLKLDASLRTRSQPHRAARFTESYDRASPDVVVISDNSGGSDSESDSDCSPMPSPIACQLSAKEKEEQEIAIQILKKQLADEEMKLLLLQKLKESQSSNVNKNENEDGPAASQQTSLIRKVPALQSTHNVTVNSMPSKNLLASNKSLIHQKQDNRDIVQKVSSLPKTPQSTHSSIVNEKVSQSKVLSLDSQSQKMIGLRQFPLLKNLSNQITVTPVPTASSSLQEDRIDSETLSQHQAAAKLALRKQLEKTLLQIPLPKRPPLKLNFFPNANSNEFQFLLGLDVAVDFLVKANKTPLSKKPLVCAQCKTDFTSTWKWKEISRHGKKEYHAYCESCIASNMRKALKAEHTNNLKSAFLKALQQEKEIDRLSRTMQKQVTEASTSSRSQRVPTPAHQSTHVSSSHHHHHLKTEASMQHIPKSTISVPQIPNHLNHAALAQQVAKLSPQFQTLLQIQAHQLLAAGLPLHPGMLAFSNLVPQNPRIGRGKPSSGQSDLRRQFNSDRVQSPIPQAKASWHA